MESLGKTEQRCCLFSYATAAEAAKHMNFDTIEIFKDTDSSGNTYKYPNDYFGGVVTYFALVQCKNCGALFSEYVYEKILSMDDGICFFTTFCAVSCRDEAMPFALKNPQSLRIEKMGWIGGVSWGWNKPKEEG